MNKLMLHTHTHKNISMSRIKLQTGQLSYKTARQCKRGIRSYVMQQKEGHVY